MRSLNLMNEPHAVTLSRTNARSLNGIVGQRTLPGVMEGQRTIEVPAQGAALTEDQRLTAQQVMQRRRNQRGG
jgi:hypothetical protein